MDSTPRPASSSRHQFGRTAAASALAGVFGAPAFLRARNLNDKLRIASIACGGRGAYVLSQVASEDIVALCDVDWAHAAGTFKQFPQAKKYKDYRTMLDDSRDIDAVIVATPAQAEAHLLPFPVRPAPQLHTASHPPGAPRDPRSPPPRTGRSDITKPSPAPVRGHMHALRPHPGCHRRPGT